LKITQTKYLFTLLLFFSSTISPLKIEEITEGDSNSASSTYINKKPFQPDFRSTLEKMGKNSHRTKTEPFKWKVIGIPRLIYIFPQNARMNRLNLSDLEKIFHVNFSEKSTLSHYDKNNIRPATPINKDHLNIAKPSPANKTRTNQQNQHNNTQSIRHRLEKINQLLIKSWIPLF